MGSFFLAETANTFETGSKDYRNSLAHGERSFKEVGRGYILDEMKKFCCNTRYYLDKLLIVFFDFIVNKKFLTINLECSVRQ